MARAPVLQPRDLANILEQEKLAGKGGRLSTNVRTDNVVLDELGYLPFFPRERPTAVPLLSKLYERLRSGDDQSDLWRWGQSLATQMTTALLTG
jgi:DNA replication protein DnaC